MPITDAFKKLENSIMKEYLGKKVPKKYQKKYGKKYNKKDILSVTFAIAKTRGIPYES